MSDSPDAIRADIESTRRDLGQDVDALADKVTPSKIVHRQTEKVKGAVGAVRERLLGAADDAGSGVSDATHRVAAKAEGNPLAVGLMAFGAGLLLASLLPASSKEKQLGAAVKNQAQPLVDEATNVAKDVGAHLKEPAQDAVAAVRDSAADAASSVKDAASDAAENVTDRAQEARETVQEEER